MVQAADRPLWFPGAAPPSYLDGSVAGDRGFDPIGLGAEPRAMAWYRAAELVHARWAMLGVAGILAQEVVHPEQWWYTSGLPENLPAIEVGGKMNIGGLLAWEFLLMHWVELRRWQDIQKPGSVNSVRRRGGEGGGRGGEGQARRVPRCRRRLRTLLLTHSRQHPSIVCRTRSSPTTASPTRRPVRSISIAIIVDRSTEREGEGGGREGEGGGERGGGE